MAEALTQRQREILDFISASIVERGFPPTLREIGEHFNIRSTNGVNDHLKALEKKGHLRREDLKSRAMRPVLPDGSGEVVPLRRAARRAPATSQLVSDATTTWPRSRSSARSRPVSRSSPSRRRRTPSGSTAC